MAVSHRRRPPLVALLASPLLGPSVWTPVVPRLRERGWDAAAVRPIRGTAPRTPEDVLEGLLGALPEGRELVLVPHSNAGLYVPQLTRHRTVAGMVFVDAVLPPPQGAVRVAPPALVEFLSEKASPDGLLPVWTEWWDAEEVASLFPNDHIRFQVEEEQVRLPLSYFAASVDAPDGWDHLPAAYLAFGETYEIERRDAERRGWPVAVLSGGHLHMLVAPEEVAAEINGLLGELSVTTRR